MPNWLYHGVYIEKNDISGNFQEKLSDASCIAPSSIAPLQGKKSYSPLYSRLKVKYHYIAGIYSFYITDIS